jgi:hypothetical protein
MRYSPKCVEWGFSEVRFKRILGSSIAQMLKFIADSSPIGNKTGVREQEKGG